MRILLRMWRKAVGLYLIAVIMLACSLQISAFASANPPEIRALNGGEIKSIKDGYIEVVNRQNVIKIYLYDKELKLEKELRDFSVVAEIQRAYSKNHETLELETSNGVFLSATKDTSVAVQFLDIGIANRRSGNADRVSFDFPNTATSGAN